MRKKKQITFKALPGARDGHVCLSLYLPYTSIFTEDGNYAVFVGGCGIGHAKRLSEAKAMLLEGAKQYCFRRIAESQHIVDHFQRQLAKLDADGLGPFTKE